jgi:hypothetical protein
MSFSIKCIELQQVGLCDYKPGLTGPTGSSGFSTNTGATGPTGPQGIQGNIGPTGPVSSYGEMYGLTGSINLGNTANSYSSVTGLTGINSELYNITFSNPPSTLTVSNTGKYLLNVDLDGSVTTNSTIFLASIWRDSTLIDKTVESITYQQSGDDRQLSISSILSLNAGDQITLKLGFSSHGGGQVTYNAHSIHVVLVQIG